MTTNRRSKSNSKTYSTRLNSRQDVDILEYLSALPDRERSACIRDLLREAIQGRRGNYVRPDVVRKFDRMYTNVYNDVDNAAPEQLEIPEAAYTIPGVPGGEVETTERPNVEDRPDWLKQTIRDLPKRNDGNGPLKARW